MLHFTFFTKKFVRLFILREVESSPDCKTIKFLTLDSLDCFHHYDILAKSRCRMMTAITFSHQKDAGSRVSNTQYLDNLVIVLVLVSESKALYLL